MVGHQSVARWDLKHGSASLREWSLRVGYGGIGGANAAKTGSNVRGNPQVRIVITREGGGRERRGGPNDDAPCDGGRPNSINRITPLPIPVSGNGGIQMFPPGGRRQKGPLKSHRICRNSASFDPVENRGPGKKSASKAPAAN